MGTTTTTAGTVNKIVIANVNICGGVVTIANNTTIGAAVRMVNAQATNSNSMQDLLNITGGNVTLAGDIIKGPNLGTGTCTATLTLNGGTLDMGIHNIGIAGGLVTANFQSGTLQNVLEINNGAVMTKTTTGTLILAGTNSYSGDTTISGGTLRLGASGVIPDGSGKGNVVLNPASGTATLDLGGFVETVNGLSSSGAGSSVVDNTTGTGTYTLTVGGNNQTGTFGGIMQNSSGTVALTKTGTGTLTLSGANTYDGLTTISQGVVILNQNTATLGSTAAGTVVQSGAQLRLTATNFVLQENLTLSGSGTGATGAGNGALGMQVNSGVITYNGTITLEGGATLGSFNAGTATMTVVQGINGTGDLTIRPGASNNGTSNWYLNGQSSYTGNTIFSTANVNGTATIRNGIDNALPTGSVLSMNGTAGSGASTVLTYVLAGYNQTIAGLSGTNGTSGAYTYANTVVGGGATLSTLTVNNTADYAFGGTLGGANSNENNLALTKNGAGTLTLSGANTYDGLTTVSNGILEVTANNALGSSALGTDVVAGAALRLNGVTYSTAEALNLNGAGMLGGGALVNVGTSSYAGVVTAVTNATVNAGGGSLTLSGGVVKNGTTLTLTGGGTVTVNGVGISGAGANSDLVVDGTTLNVDVASSYNGPTFIRNGGILNANVVGALPTSPRSALTLDDTGTGGSSLVLTANQEIASLTGAASSIVNLNANTLTIGTTAGSTTYAGTISGAGGVLTKDGASTVLLSGTNSYTGGTNITGGVLSVSSLNALGTVGTINFGGGTLEYTGSNHVDYSSRLGATANQAYHVNTNGQAVTWTSNLTSSGGTLTKDGLGSLTLTGSNSYSGTTTVNGGELIVNGTHTGGGAYDILSTGTLGGNGTINANLTVQSGGFLSPGTSVGTLTITGNVTQVGQLTVEIGAPGVVDLLVVSGQYDITGGSVNFLPSQALSGDYMFVTYGTLTGQPYTVANTPTGYTIDYNYVYGGTPNHIALVPIPEPATIAGLATLGLMGAAGWWWRQRQKLDRETSNRRGDDGSWYDTVGDASVLL